MIVQQLVDSVTGYPGFWLLCASSGVVVPLPEDVSLMYAGAHIADGLWSWPATLAVAWAGVAVRDVISWGFGRYVVRWLLGRERLAWLVTGRRATRARTLVEEHGPAAVLLGRFLIGFRAPVFVAAGAVGVPLRSFVLYDGAGLAIAIPIALGLGFWFGAPIAEIAAAVLQRTTTATVVAVVAAIVAFVTWRTASPALAAARPLRRGIARVPVEDDPSDLG